MQLRALVRLASAIIAYYWPMRTFVHHNPLHGLEQHHFDEAARAGHRWLGGRGYLPNDMFREYARIGRILPNQLDAALAPLAQHESVALSARAISRLEVLRAHLLHGFSAPPPEILDAAILRSPDRALIEGLSSRLENALPGAQRPGGEVPLGRGELLAGWCDRNLGTRLVEQINRETIKWCAAFLDEGHAAWAMPGREKGFYGAWKFLAQREWSPCGIRQQRQKIAALPSDPEAALIESLTALGVEREAWQDYISLHLSALPGWAGFIKWRADQDDYLWQQAYPVDLVHYLAMRLWYERELVQKTCRQALGNDGTIGSIAAHLEKTASTPSNAHGGTVVDRRSALAAAWRLAALARALEIEADSLSAAAPETLRTVLAWIDELPESAHGPVWLKALEAGYQEGIRAKLERNVAILDGAAAGYGAARTAAASALQDEARAQDERHDTGAVRPQAQAVFCIDVRSEPLRRHLEAIGDYETFGFAGFFNVPMRYQALGAHHETDQLPVIVKAKNLVREIARSYQGQSLFKHRSRARLVEAGHELLHDLKENVATPYVMVESVGWFYSLPMIGKTIFRSWYRKAAARLKLAFLRPVATTLTVDKLSRAEVEEMLAAEQRATARRVLQEKFGDRHLNLSLERLEFLRRRALDEASAEEAPAGARSYALSREEENIFIDELRRSYGINQRTAFARAERITRTGFTAGEQVLTVEAVLRMMGLTRNFARLVLLCGHGSRSDNNPYEAALDCGACGGNHGGANARVLALMANKPALREQLAKNGIVIPQDTYFIAGEHDTATDHVELFDLEDLPPTHRKDLLQFTRDLEEAGRRNNRERCTRFPGITSPLTASRAAREVERRSGDWSQVRPEWGLSNNAAFIVGRRRLTRGMDLAGRAFLQSYDHREDSSGRLLELIMTGPQIVAQWINLEHYFSTVDQDVYGSGSKIYHNVVGRFGIMSGPQSDLRTGLAWQTVMDGPRPYHEPMRLLTVIEAPRERIDRILQNNAALQRLYDNEWIHLMVLVPQAGNLYRYIPKQGWRCLTTRKEAGS
jgi:uncharacterized protein YbcC (UPF0753/DUF2309 family)